MTSQVAPYRVAFLLLAVSAVWATPPTIRGETFLDVDRQSMTPVEVRVKRRAEPLDPETDGRLPPEERPAIETILATLPDGRSIPLGKCTTHPHGASRQIGIIPESVRGWRPTTDKLVRVLTWDTYAQGQGGYTEVGVCVVRLGSAAPQTLYAGEVLVHWRAGGMSGGSGCRTIGVRNGSLVIRDEAMKCDVPTWPGDGKPPALYRWRRMSDLCGSGYDDGTDPLLLAAEITERTVRTLSLSDAKAAFVTRHYHRVTEGTTLDEIARYYRVPAGLLLALSGKESPGELTKQTWIEIPAAPLVNPHGEVRQHVEPQLVERVQKAVGDVSAYFERKDGVWYLRRMADK